MPKDAKKNIDRYKIRGGDLNEYEFSQNQARVKESFPGSPNPAMPMKGSPPMMVEKTTAQKSAKEETAKKSATTKKAAKKTTAKKSAKKAKKPAKKATKKSAKKSTKKSAKK